MSLFVTRRVHGRQMRLRPSKRLNQIVSYIIAVKAKQYNIRLHALMVMGNHYHLVISDPDGNAPAFERDCNSLIGRHVNRSYGDFESLWSGEQSSRVECGTPSDVVNKIAYTMANPVEAGLVRYGHSWPGVRMSWPQPPREVPRPKGFFRDESQGGKMPATATLEFHRPTGYDELSDDELAELIEEAIESREAGFRDKFDREGKPFLGRRAVRKQSRYSFPQSKEPRFGISPRVAAKNKWHRIEMLQRNRAWSRAYRRARARWLAGTPDVEFPYGTYKLRIEASVRCAEPPT